MEEFVIPFVIGTVIMGSGFGRWLGTDPTCAACGYDLRGGRRPWRRCSECGADLGQPDAVAQGLKKSRPRRLIIGVAIMALSIGVPKTIEYGRKVDWAPYYSTSRLIREVDASQRVCTLPGGGWSKSGPKPAERELGRRIVDGGIEDGDVRRIVALALPVDDDADASTPTPFVLRWAEIIGLLHANGRVDDAWVLSYVRRAFDAPFTLTVKRPNGAGSAGTVFSLKGGPTGGLGGLPYGYLWSVEEIRVDDAPYPLYGTDMHYQRCFGMPFVGWGISTGDRFDLEPGAHTVTFDVRVAIVRHADALATLDPGLRGDWSWVSLRGVEAEGLPEAVHVWTEELTATFDIR